MANHRIHAVLSALGITLGQYFNAPQTDLSRITRHHLLRQATTVEETVGGWVDLSHSVTGGPQPREAYAVRTLAEQHSCEARLEARCGQAIGNRRRILVGGIFRGTAPLGAVRVGMR